jgi:hypothetical protein
MREISLKWNNYGQHSRIVRWFSLEVDSKKGTFKGHYSGYRVFLKNKIIFRFALDD